MVAAPTLTMMLTVNPAFLQEIKDSNPDLWDTVHRLRQTCQCEEEPSVTARQLARLLDALRDHLALQFSLEESYGYLEVPIATTEYSTTEFSVTETTNELAIKTHAQHCSLYLQLSDLAEQAEELQYRGVEPVQLRLLVQSVEDFDALLRAHEQSEHELIESSYHCR